MSFQHCKIRAVGPKRNAYFTQKHGRGDRGFAMSSSALREFARCPARWLAGYEPPASAPRDFGSLLDCLLLTPGQFDDRYVVRPATYKDGQGTEREWHHASKTCRDWLNENAGREVISPAQFAEAQVVVNRLLADRAVADFIAESDKQVWLAGEWKADNGVVFPVKCLIDLVPPAAGRFSGSIADVKTTRNAALSPWQRQVFDLGYHVQAAFNLDFHRAARPAEARQQFCHIVVENYEPWQVGKRIVSPAFLELGRTQYRRALNTYAHCLKSGHWPGYDDARDGADGWSIIEPAPWMAAASA